MAANIGNFSAYNDKSGSSYNGTDLQQLNFETNVIHTSKDPLSGLESVVLSGGPFAYSTESYINGTISDFRKVPTSNIKKHSKSCQNYVREREKDEKKVCFAYHKLIIKYI